MIPLTHPPTSATHPFPLLRPDPTLPRQRLPLRLDYGDES